MAPGPPPGTLNLRALPPHADLVAECAEAAAAHFEAFLPDLRRAVILMPHQLQRGRLRRRLLEAAQARGHEAVLPPVIGTLHSLFLERTPARGLPALSEHERRLVLACELDQHPDLFSHAGRWEFSDRLLQLFDEIAAARDSEEPLTEPVPGFAGNFVQTLYNAWQAHPPQKPDLPALYRDGLRNDALVRDDEHVFLCGFNELSPCESAWAARLYRRGRLTLVGHAGAEGRYPSAGLKVIEAVTGLSPSPASSPASSPAEPEQDGDARSRLIDAAFSADGDVVERAHGARRTANGSLCGTISVFKPESQEQHAVGIYLKIRDWLEAGVSPVAVASRDRKLLRRLRAVLDRNGVAVCDHAGWALSTTASAAAAAALLPSSEQGFGADAVLALARSPFCNYGGDVVATQKVCARLERALAELDPFADFGETITALKALDLGEREFAGLFRRTVERIDDAVGGLQRILQGGRRPFIELFDALFAAMDALGMTERLRKDEAGLRVFEELEAMAAAARAQDSDKGGGARWNLWRRWILHTFENENFTPKEHNYLVEIYNLPQAVLARPAGLVVAALDAGRALSGETMPLLDEEARRAFGLAGRKHRVSVQFARFRAALESAERVLLTCESGGGEAPAPWLDGLQHFHALVTGDDLEEPDLKRRAQAEIRTSGEAFEDGLARPQMPAPMLPEPPESLSVTDVQTAVACPYRFFAKTALKLLPAPEADDYDSGRDYGSRLHRCLAALHDDVAGLPGPVNKPWTEDNRDYAHGVARAIVEAEFGPRAARHYSAAERMQKAHAALRWYIEWLIGNVPPDARFETETPRETALEDGLTLRGRADCVIRGDDGLHVLDHKSGGKHSRKDMTDGEDVQLTAYSLLHDGVNSVSYMDMKNHKPVTLDGEDLEQARARLRERLHTFRRDAADKPLPAWADDAECRYCRYAGVCRRNSRRETRRNA